MHTLVYADDPDAARDFFRDVLRFDHVDAGGGWLIFNTGPSELGVHPTDPGTRHHEISLLCDDIVATVAELKERWATFARDEVRDEGWGLTTMLEVPGGGEMLLYQPRHAPAAELG